MGTYKIALNMCHNVFVCLYVRVCMSRGGGGDSNIEMAGCVLGT